jgi:AcrR family transcriptional regulator
LDVPRQRTRRAPRHETQRQLVDAAAKVVAKRGFRGATVEAITNEAGLTSGALYSNFKTKEELFLRLYVDKIHSRVLDLRQMIDRHNRAQDVVTAAVEDEARVLADRQWLLLYIEFVLYAARTPSFARRFAAARRERLAERADAIRAGLAKFDRRPIDADFLVRAGSGLTYGMALHNLIDRDDGAVDDVAQGLRYLLDGELRKTRGGR